MAKLERREKETTRSQRDTHVCILVSIIIMHHADGLHPPHLLE